MRNKFSTNLLKKSADKIAVFLVILLCVGAGFLGFFQKFDYRLYDFMLSLKKEPKSRQEILFVEIDNKSLEDFGPWPWSRDILANALLRMKELGAKTAVFDIEYLSPSRLGINPQASVEIGNAIDSQKKDVSDFISQVAEAAVSGMYEKNDLINLVSDTIKDSVNPEFDSLKESVLKSSFQDNDELFAKAIQFFGDTWLTVNLLDLELKYSPEYLEYARKKCLYFNVQDKNQRILKGNQYYLIDQGGDNKLGFSPAIEQFMKSAKGAGFTNVVLDSDGTRRRVELLSRQNEGYAGQLAFAPILKKLDPKEIIREPFSLKLIDAKNPDNEAERINITIPLDIHGRMLVNWLNKEFVESFRHESVVFFHQLDEAESNIVSLLEVFDGFNLWDAQGKPLAYKEEVSGLLNDYNSIKQYKSFLLQKCRGFAEDGSAIDGGILPEEYTDYFDARQNFFERVRNFIDGFYFEEINSRLDEMKNELDEQNYIETKDNIKSFYEALKHEDELYLGTFNQKKKAYEGSFCIVGNTASSTTDLGTTPFNRAYPNVGTHANVYNTIMNQNFVREIHWLLGFAIASLLAFLSVIYTGGKKVWVQNMFGIFTVIVSVGLPFGLMRFFGLYVPVVAPVVVTGFSYLLVVVLHFVMAEKDKVVLRNAFSTYLAPAVVEEIVKDPSKLKLGGDEKRITALFSDIKSFSAFSELVTPTKLVSILNEYLGSMSDRILAEQGTIDKYIGDSIVSFFGAPIDLKNSAWSACVSAIRMKQEELLFNTRALADGTIPMALETRIGINSGEMVVGNMGTSAKMNYTIMGDAVNLASRLEGVNKAYKSWILCSDATWNEANSGENFDKILARKLDRVRVVGRAEPVQLWNILGFREELPENVLEAAEIFKSAMELYLKKDFVKAGKLFIKANKLVPEDETPLVYAQRCKEYLENGLSENWDGIVNMTSK